MADKQWRPFGAWCDECGCDSVEVFTASGQDLLAHDDDEARCVECGCPGTVGVDEGCAYIRWHDEPDCDCSWCLAMKYHEVKAARLDAALRTQLAEARQEFCVMARACGNWREWPGEAESDHEHDDWKAAARAFIELAALRTQLAEAKAERDAAQTRYETQCQGTMSRLQEIQSLRQRAETAESHLAASEAKRKLLVMECKAARAPKGSGHRINCVCVYCQAIKNARAATDASSALETTDENR